MSNLQLTLLLVLMVFSWLVGSDLQHSALNVILTFGGFMTGLVLRAYLITRAHNKEEEL